MTPRPGRPWPDAEHLPWYRRVSARSALVFGAGMVVGVWSVVALLAVVRMRLR
jgi:hypothetical protein